MKHHNNELNRLLLFPDDIREKLLPYIEYKEMPSKTILLREGEIPSKMFLVIKGCLRIYYIKEDGTEITSQFFLENQVVSSFESAFTGTPSRQYIETIEDSVVAYIKIKHLRKLINDNEAIRELFHSILIVRLIFYMNQHSSFVLDNPEKRYKKLAQENPEIMKRIPQQYIASYLGITPVSLSRIKNRLKKK